MLEILQAQLLKADAQLSELTAFKRDVETNIARMQDLIAEAKQG